MDGEFLLHVKLKISCKFVWLNIKHLLPADRGSYTQPGPQNDTAQRPPSHYKTADSQNAEGIGN